jgi:hypothetical protein
MILPFSTARVRRDGGIDKLPAFHGMRTWFLFAGHCCGIVYAGAAAVHFREENEMEVEPKSLSDGRLWWW